MARTITTSFTPRTKPTTSFQVNRTREAFLLLEDGAFILLEDWNKILLEESVVTDFVSKRYSNYLETLDWLNLFWLEWVEILTIWWHDVNKIDTIFRN